MGLRYTEVTNLLSLLVIVQSRKISVSSTLHSILNFMLGCVIFSQLINSVDLDWSLNNKNTSSTYILLKNGFERGWIVGDPYYFIETHGNISEGLTKRQTHTQSFSLPVIITNEEEITLDWEFEHIFEYLVSHAHESIRLVVEIIKINTYSFSMRDIREYVININGQYSISRHLGVSKRN